MMPDAVGFPLSQVNGGRSAFHPFIAGLRNPAMPSSSHSANQMLSGNSLLLPNQPFLSQQHNPPYAGLTPFSTFQPTLLQPNLLTPQNSSSNGLFNLNGYTSSHLLSGLAAAKQRSEVHNLAKTWALNGFIRDIGSATYNGKFRCDALPIKDLDQNEEDHEATSSGQ